VTEPVPIARKFTPVPTLYQRNDEPLEELWPSLMHGGRKSWEDLLGEYRVVILADAGAGKTHELRRTAARLIESGKAAFFLRLEDIDDGFGQAFELGAAEAFDTWLAGSGPAWFFLDSVDDLRLSEARAFEAAIRAFAGRLQGALQRAHIYITSRPYAWRTSLDRAFIAEILPHQRLSEQTLGSSEDDEAREDGTVGGINAIVDVVERVPEDPSDLESGEEDSEATPALAVYLLAPLSDEDIRLFAAALAIVDVDAFLAALEHRNLFPLARVPFDLRDLIEAWRSDGQLGNRLAVLQGSVARLLTSLTGVSANLETTLDAVQVLAVATSLTGLSNIRLPGFGGSQAIDAELLLKGWTAPQINKLLASGVFGDPIFGEVRFRHREIRDLLAAEWADAQFNRDGGRAEIERLVYAAPYGVDIFTPRLRPLLPWLILFDQLVRERVLNQHPEIAIEGGDAASLPHASRETLLSTLLEQVVDPASSLRGIDNAAIARIAQSDLEAFVSGLVERYHDNDDAIFVLARLVWQGALGGCLAPLIEIAADSNRGIYARLVSVRAVATTGSAAQLQALWALINASATPIPRRLLAEFAEYALADAENIALLIRSLERLEPRGQFEATGLTSAINNFIDRVPLDSDPGLPFLADGLQRLFEQPPYVEQRECHVSEEYQWLMSPALHVIERLILARAPAAVSDTSLAILAAVPALRFWRADDYQDRKSAVDGLVPAWIELNDALFWRTVASYRLARSSTDDRLIDDWPITFIGHFWAFDAASFARTLSWVTSRELPDDRLVALARTFTTYVENDKPASWLAEMQAAVASDATLTAALDTKLNPPQTEASRQHQAWERKYKRDNTKRKRREEKDRAAFVADVMADPKKVRKPPGVKRGQFARIHYNLLRMIEGEGVRESRAQGADWQSLIPEVGLEVAEAYRDAALAHWRSYKPGLRSEGADTSQTPYALIFAMAGLDIELSVHGTAAALSTAHVRRALRYVIWELNGFPRWFETLFRARPKLGREFIWNEVEWELRNTPSDEPLHYVLSDLVYYAPWLHAEFGAALFEWLKANRAPNLKCLGYLRTIILSGQGASDAEIAALARGKLADDATPDDQLPTWYAIWVDCEPAPAIASLERLFDDGALSDPLLFAMSFVVALLGGRSDTSTVNGFGQFKSPTYLKQLYLLMHRQIPADDDLQRAGGGVYSPILRDDAQDARERLFQLLNQISGSIAYAAINELASTHPVDRYRNYMAVQAYAHAVADGDVAAWKVAEVATFARRIEALPILEAASAAD
jgi:hypothetical protein